MACGHGFRSWNSTSLTELSGLWTDDAYLRSSLSPLPYPGRADPTDLQAQPLSRSDLSGTRQDQEPELEITLPAPDGHRLGRLLLDRTSTLFTPHGDLLIRSNSWTTTTSSSPKTRSTSTSALPIMLAARQQDAELLRSNTNPRPDHPLHRRTPAREGPRDTLRRAGADQKRVWFAEPLLSATEDEVRRLIQKAKAWPNPWARPWGFGCRISRRRSSRRSPRNSRGAHRYCDNHFLRDLAKPVLEATACKVAMRKKVRGLRVIEQAVLARQKAQTKDNLTPETPEATAPRPWRERTGLRPC